MDYTSVEDLRSWALAMMASRPPDFVIGDDYLKRWWVVPRNQFDNTYLHEILRSDDDRAFHDHPWNNSTLVLDGEYIEHTPTGSFVRKAGDYIQRPATTLHRLEIPDGGRAITLFTTGPKIREWGFDCPQGWRHWRDFTAGEHGETVGRGCE